MSSSGSKSLGRILMPQSLHDKLQFDRHPITEFIRKNALPRMEKGQSLLDAGAGRIKEQLHREEYLAKGLKLETQDYCAGPGVDHIGDLAHTDLPGDKFDWVVCTQVLEHVDSPAEVCQELFRVLKPGGRAAITAPMSAYLHDLPYHFFHFTRIGMTKLVEDAGFKVEVLEPQGGHFRTLGVHLHYTCRVLKTFRKGFFSKLLLTPIILALSVLFGLVAKLFLMKLDDWFPFEGNTQGWNVIVRKPDANDAQTGNDKSETDKATDSKSK